MLLKSRYSGPANDLNALFDHFHSKIGKLITKMMNNSIQNINLIKINF